MATLEISIGGQSYFLKGEESEEHLREVAELVRRKVESLIKKNPNLSVQKAAMLAAFDFASETIKGQRKGAEYRATVLAKAQGLLEKVEAEINPA